MTIPANTQNAYNQQWNFSIQRSLATNTLLQVAYVGNKGTHLAWSGGGGSSSMNQLAPGLSGLGNNLLTLVSNPFYGIITTGPRGKTWGSSLPAVADYILGGWQANGILTLASGQPLVFSTAANNSYTFGGGQHLDVVGNPVLSSGKSIYEWFNTAAFAQPANFTSGDLSRTFTGVRADWTRNLDFSLFKNFSLTERFHLQFRAEAFNLTNTPVFSAPGAAINGANFGVITGQSNTVRSIQLALKLSF